MKILNKMVLVVVIGAVSLGSYACGNSGANEGDSAMYEAILAVAPSFAPSASMSLSAALRQAQGAAKDVPEGWGAGNPLYEIFYMMRDFDPAADQGVIDTSNLFKTMWELRGIASRDNCSGVQEQVIAPPFDFGTEDGTYNCAENDIGTASGYDSGFAMVELDEFGAVIPAEGELLPEAVIQKVLKGFVWSGSHNEYGVIAGRLDKSSDDLSVDIAVWVDYAGDDDYCYRDDIDGNAATHEFTIRTVKGNITGGASITLVGKGRSEGAGEYFLLKVTASELTGRYFCIGADDGEAELSVMDPEGSDVVDANCAALQTDVDALEPFTAADLLCEAADLNPGGAGDASEGTVFLNFE